MQHWSGTITALLLLLQLTGAIKPAAAADAGAPVPLYVENPSFELPWTATFVRQIDGWTSTDNAGVYRPPLPDAYAGGLQVRKEVFGVISVFWHRALPAPIVPACCGGFLISVLALWISCAEPRRRHQCGLVATRPPHFAGWWLGEKYRGVTDSFPLLLYLISW